MKLLTTSLLLLPLLALPSTVLAEDDRVPVPYTLCTPTPSSGSNKATITIDSVMANVWPPQAGKSFDVVAKGSSSEDIQGGTYHVEVKLDELTVLDKKGDLRDVGITFPVKAGPTEIHKSVKIPAQVPDGQLVVTGYAYDQDKNELLCVIVTADMGGSPDGESSQSRKLGKIVIPNLSHHVAEVESQYKQQQQQASLAQSFDDDDTSDSLTVSEPLQVIEIHISGGGDQSTIRSLVQSIAHDMQHTIHRIRSGMLDWYASHMMLPHHDEPAYLLPSRGEYDELDMWHLPQKSYRDDLTHDLHDDPELHDLPYSLCGDEDDPIQITSIKADNWPLVAGKPITMYVTANVLKQVDNGNYEAKVLFDGLQVIDKKDTLERLGVQLPLKEGENKFHKTFDVPKNIPQGDVLLSATAHSLDGQELMCATIEMHL